ncbi:MAG: HAMP domain-containing histidine kinase [Gemmatimonadaceae bacterium]|nr:HAMP domain-containing histidine kinase [Gemmatimonadaceae bacterium]
MASVRSRIMASYGGATIGALALLVAILIAQRRAAVTAQIGEEATNTAALASGIIERQSFRGVAVDALGTPTSPFTPTVSSLLDHLPGYIIIGDSTQVFYWSRDVRQIQAQAANNALIGDIRGLWRQDLDRLTGAAYSIRRGGEPRVVSLNFDDVMLVASLHDPPLGGGVRRIVVGVSMRRVTETTREMASVALLSAPLLIAVSLLAAWMLGGRILEPVQRVVADVGAITDGRSLHRRVVVEGDARDEFGSLARTLNDMLSRLEVSFGALRRFTADASHELRTPLAVIRADVERAMATPRDAHEHAVALEEALHEVSRMTGLVESLLTLARADEGRFDIVRVPLDLEAVIRDVAETAQILGEERGVTVTMPRMESVAVEGDPERLRQLFLNIATNAVKYTSSGGTVEISLEARHDEAIVTVRDDGIGIAAADLPFVFDRFWRADLARTRSTGGGAGLGLAISQWIAQAHDGRIDVASRLGRGTTFTVILPQAPGGARNI